MKKFIGLVLGLVLTMTLSAPLSAAPAAQNLTGSIATDSGEYVWGDVVTFTAQTSSLKQNQQAYAVVWCYQNDVWIYQQLVAVGNNSPGQLLLDHPYFNVNADGFCTVKLQVYSFKKRVAVDVSEVLDATEFNVRAVVV